METMLKLFEARANAGEPVVADFRKAWGEMEEWASQLGRALNREIGGKARFLGGVGVSRTALDTVEIYVNLDTPGEREKDETLRQAMTWLKQHTKSTWELKERYGKPSLVATYDL